MAWCLIKHSNSFTEKRILSKYIKVAIVEPAQWMSHRDVSTNVGSTWEFGVAEAGTSDVSSC
jgi:hypothetical protein